MEASEIQDVCRLCPENGISSEPLLNVFNRKFGDNINMKDVIFITTGIEIMETDLVSRKICQRCRNIIIKMNNFRQDAIKHDKALKEKCNKILFEKGFRLPDYSMTKQEIMPESIPPCPKLKMEINDQISSRRREIFLHPSVQQIYKMYPNLTMPKTCIDRHMAPVVLLFRDSVEKYFRTRNLDMRNFTCLPNGNFKDSTLKTIAKKRTSAVAAKRKVTPIKISKRLFGSQGSSTSYVCSSTVKPNLAESSAKKRLVSSSESNQRNKMFKQDGSPPHSRLIVEAVNLQSKVSPHSNFSLEALKQQPEASPKKTQHNLEMKQPGSSALKTVHGPEKSGGSPVSQVSQASESSKTPQSSVKASRHLTEYSVSKSVNIPSSIESTCSSDSRSELVEDTMFNLTPRVKAIKSQKLCHCQICGDVLHNVFELRRHNLKHSVCQFCKRKCKSVEDKKIHVRNFCETKKVMNQEVSVSLERINLNLHVRKTYQNAFIGFEAIPDLVEPKSTEGIAACATSSLSSNIIVLSDDDEENQAKDLLAHVPAVATEEPSQIVYHTVAIVKPDVRIKHSDVLENLPPTLTDKMLLKELIELNSKPTTVNRLSNTDFPTSKDVHASISNGTCDFKNLKEQLMFFKVPIEINNGPFNVGYRFQEAKASKKVMQLWNLVPLIDIKGGAGRDKGKDAVSSSVTRHRTQSSNAALSATSSDTIRPIITKSYSRSTSKVKNTALMQSPAMANSKPSLKSNTIINTPPIQLNSTTVANNIPPLQSVVTTSGIHMPDQATKSTFPPASSIPPLRQSQPCLLVRPPAPTEASCATPLLNNYYVRSMPPSIPPHNKLTPIPRSYINAAMNIRNMAVVSSNNTLSPYSSPNAGSSFVMNPLFSKHVPVKFTQVNISQRRPASSASTSAEVNSIITMENNGPLVNTNSSSAAAVSVPSSSPVSSLVPMPSAVPVHSLAYVSPTSSSPSLAPAPSPIPIISPMGVRPIRVKNVKELQ